MVIRYIGMGLLRCAYWAMAFCELFLAQQNICIACSATAIVTHNDILTKKNFIMKEIYIAFCLFYLFGHCIFQIIFTKQTLFCFFLVITVVIFCTVISNKSWMTLRPFDILSHFSHLWHGICSAFQKLIRPWHKRQKATIQKFKEIETDSWIARAQKPAEFLAQGWTNCLTWPISEHARFFTLIETLFTPCRQLTLKNNPIYHLLLSIETFYASCPSVFTKGRMVAYDLLVAGVAQLLGG